MRKLFYKLVVLFIMLFGVSVGTVEAQQQPQNIAESAPGSVNSDSFGDIAALGEQIALAQRKIQAMELKTNLEALEAQQTTGHLPYKVLRIEGFGDVLYAVLSDEAGVLYQVGPGDFIGNDYRVTLIRPTLVGAININTRQFYPVPFVFGEGTSGVMTTEFSDGITPSTTSAPTANTPKAS